MSGWAPRSRLEGPRTSNVGLTYGEWRLGDDAVLRVRAGKLWGLLDDLHSLSPLSLVAWEGTSAHFKSKAAAMSIIGLTGALLAWCEVNGVQDHMVMNTSVKKHATGSGVADEQAMEDAARRLGWNPLSHNACDALFVLDLCLSEYHRR